MRNFGDREKAGGLGNQLFQLNSMIGLAKHYGHRLVLPRWQYEEYFDTHQKDVVFLDRLPPIISTITEKHFHYDIFQFDNELSKQTQSKFGAINIKGYLQSRDYFKTAVPTLHDWVYNKLAESIGYTGMLDSELIAIHIRRGDYVDNPYYHQLYNTTYFNHAIELIPGWKNMNIIIFSDDKEYAARFRNDLLLFYRPVFKKRIIIADKPDIEELCWISMCDYHVLSNSTFGWWGAFLSKSKMVIRPMKYFAGEGLKNDITGFWPEEWIGIDG